VPTTLATQRDGERSATPHRPGQEHVFYAHADPRWLTCDCGQFAQRTRTPLGQYAVRLIDDPTGAPALRPWSAPAPVRA
jgi:hypothetical protein